MRAMRLAAGSAFNCRFSDNTQSVSQNVPFANPSLAKRDRSREPAPLDIRNMFPAPVPIGGRQFPSPYCQAPQSVGTVDPKTGLPAVVLVVLLHR